jgi:hypothetical protein
VKTLIILPFCITKVMDKTTEQYTQLLFKGKARQIEKDIAFLISVYGKDTTLKQVLEDLKSCKK